MQKSLDRGGVIAEPVEPHAAEHPPREGIRAALAVADGEAVFRPRAVHERQQPMVEDVEELCGFGESGAWSRSGEPPCVMNGEMPAGGAAEAEAVHAAVLAEAREAIAFAEASPYPEPSDLMEDVYTTPAGARG